MWHDLFVVQIPIAEKIIRTVAVYLLLAALFRGIGKRGPCEHDKSGGKQREFFHDGVLSHRPGRSGRTGKAYFYRIDRRAWLGLLDLPDGGVR